MRLLRVWFTDYLNNKATTYVLIRSDRNFAFQGNKYFCSNSSYIPPHPHHLIIIVEESKHVLHEITFLFFKVE